MSFLHMTPDDWALLGIVLLLLALPSLIKPLANGLSRLLGIADPPPNQKR